MALCPDSNFELFGFSIGLNNLFGKSLRNKKKTSGKNLSISKVRNQAET